MPKRKKSGGVRARAGRKPLAEHGIEKRDKKVLASFTPTEHRRLERQADNEGVTVSELVAQKANGIL